MASMCSSSPRSMPDRGIDWFRVKVISYKSDARPGTFFARDNICQFILWCRSLRILECLLFETDDLVSRKNEKSFILCLLEVARIGFKVGMPTPLIIQLEQEIDREIENDAKLQKQLEDDHVKDGQNDQQLVDRDLADFLDDNNHYGASNDNGDSVNDASTQLKQQTAELNNNDDENERDAKADKLPDHTAEATPESEEEEFNEDFGPKPQLVLNDLMNLHERVSQTHSVSHPIVRSSELYFLHTHVYSELFSFSSCDTKEKVLSSCLNGDVLPPADHLRRLCIVLIRQSSNQSLWTDRYVLPILIAAFKVINLGSIVGVPHVSTAIIHFSLFHWF